MRQLGALVFACCLACGQTFEVISVKTNPSGSGHSDTDVDGNLLRMTNVTLKAMITWAYRVTDAEVLGPPWMESERFDVVAKTESGKPDPKMMESALADRFKLNVHRETKELTVYSLVVAKGGPKLKKVDPSRDDITSRRGHLTATSISMNGLARFLAGPNVRLGRPVVNKTGLDGVFDFTLDWTPENSTQSAADAHPPVFVALQEQLGLKLESQKAPVEVLVVDRVEKIPTEN